MTETVLPLDIAKSILIGLVSTFVKCRGGSQPRKHSPDHFNDLSNLSTFPYSDVSYCVELIRMSYHGVAQNKDVAGICSDQRPSTYVAQ